MEFGSVKYFNLDKGYGLIVRDNGAEDIVVRQSEVDQAGLGQLAARQRIGFDIESCTRGRKAVNLWATFGNR
jgi:CspA family cold shock protein